MQSHLVTTEPCSPLEGKVFSGGDVSSTGISMLRVPSYYLTFIKSSITIYIQQILCWLHKFHKCWWNIIYCLCNFVYWTQNITSWLMWHQIGCSKTLQFPYECNNKVPICGGGFRKLDSTSYRPSCIVTDLCVWFCFCQMACLCHQTKKGFHCYKTSMCFTIESAA